jgi:uncharacterized protein
MEILRSAVTVIQKKLKLAPIVAILGPRQVGKTTLAHQVAKVGDKPYLYLDMESAQDIAKIQDDPETFFQYHKNKLIIIDEIQAFPILFSRLRSIVDRHKEMQFMILGSASPNLVHGVSESLAGRVTYVDLNPINVQELGTKIDWRHHWFRGGFPKALLAESDEAYHDWMMSYTRTYIQSDLSVLFGYNLNPTITRRLWVMLAANHGNLVNVQDLSRSIGVTSPVINRYIQFLNGAFLIYSLHPWSTNTIKRLVKSPKIYIKDSGIMHSLMNIQSFDQLSFHPMIGASWEGYVIEQIMYNAPAGIEFFFYRTHNGTEIDLVLVYGQKIVAAIEIKYSNAPSPSKGFFIGIEDLGSDQNFIITPSSDVYFIKKAIVCSLSAFIREFLPEITKNASRL